MAVTTPDPHGAGSTSGSRWWGITTHGVLFITMATSRPANYTAGPFMSKAAAQKWLNQQEQNISQRPNFPNPFGWLGSIGGMIASGIESGFVTLLKDIWNVIVGPVEIIAGFILMVALIIWFFKDDIMSGAAVAAGLVSK